MGVGTLQQGMQSLQQAFQFLEQKRQFEEDQTRLNRMQDANWGKQMLDEMVKTTDAHSIKDVAKKYPGFLSLVFQRGMGIDEGQAMPMITALANSAYNDVESTSWAHTIWNRFGTGDGDAQAIVKDATARATGMSTVSSNEGGKTQPAGQVPASGVTGRPDFSPTTGRVSEPLSNAPPRGPSIVDELKAKLVPLVTTYGIKDNLVYQDTINAFINAHPNDRPELEAFAHGEFQNFKKSVVAGASPGALSNVPSSALPPATPSSLADAFKLGATVEPSAPKTPPIRKEQITTVAQTAAPATTVSVKSTPQIADSFQNFLEAMDSGSTGQVAAKGKKLAQAISPVVSEQLQSNPEGIRQATQNALFLLTDPVNARAIALEQNAPAVFANDQERAMTGAQGKVAAQKYFMELTKLGYDVETARIKMLDAGITAKESQAKMIAASITANMLESGVLPPEMSASLRANLDSMNKQKAIIEKMVADKADEKAIKDASSQYDVMRGQYFLTMKAAKEAIGQVNTPEAKALAASMDQKLQFTGYVGWFGRRKKGKLEMSTPQAQMPTMTGAGGALDAEVNGTGTP
jgi:hypothetical protein